MTMNDLALEALGAPFGTAAAALDGELAAGLRPWLANGIERRGEVLVWSGSLGDAASAPGKYPDLSGWECDDSSFHLEDFVPVEVKLLYDHVPQIDDADQRVLLRQGIAFAGEFARLVRDLAEQVPVRALVGVGDTSGTFRFHRIRPGESWTAEDLDGYREEKVVVLDIRPAHV
jgi:hypothetical protein